MTIRTEPWPTGVPCWADIQVPDVPAAQAFYSAVLGWTFTDPDAAFGGYVMGQIEGRSAAGIGPTFGAPPAWLMYFATDDVEKTAANAVEHGGTVVMPPGDVGASGRLAILADPTGAVFGLWQAGQHIGAEHVNAPGGITWEDLRTPDPDAARAFYSVVFGCTFQSIEGAPADYTMFEYADEQGARGGIGGMFGPEGGGPHWLIYFSVADADSAVAAATANGGEVLAEPTDTPFGRMAGLRDPHGAAFWVVQAQQA